MDFKLFVSACLTFVTVTAAFSADRKMFQHGPVTDGDNYILECQQEPIELGIVLDSSSSIRHKDFLKGIKFLQDFVSQYNIGDDRSGVRVSIITYGRGIYPNDGFDLLTFKNKEDIIAALETVPHRAGLYTDTGKAIAYMHRQQLSPDVTRPFAQKIGLVITDGNSQEYKFTKQASAEAREDGITMFAVGVGRGIRDEELLNIAGDESRVTRVDNYDKLEGILKTLAHKTCIKKLKTTTPAPKTQACGELNPSDVYFVFNPASLGEDGTAWATSFASNTISAKDMAEGFQYGVISGSCPDDSGFDLDEYSSIQEIKQRLDAFNSNKMEALVKRLVSEGFSESSGARQTAEKVAVLFASGSSKDLADLEFQVSAMAEEGIRVFLADPMDRGIEINGAITLGGRSSRQQSEQLVNELCS